MFFNDVRAQVTAATATALTTVVPPSTSTGLVSVQTADGGATSASAFTILPSSGTVDSSARMSLGDSRTTNLSATGHYFVYSFTAQRNQRLLVQITGITGGLSLGKVDLYDPFGRLLGSKYVTGPTYIETQALFDGDYAIFVSANSISSPGTLSFTLWGSNDVSGGQVQPSIAGTTVNSTTTVIGQRGVYTFKGTAGNRVYVALTPAPAYTTLQLREPWDDQPIGSKAGGSANTEDLDVTTLPETGVYELEVDQGGIVFPYTTGTATTVLYDVPPDLIGPNITPTTGGVDVNLTTQTPGQNASFTFSGTTGQHILITRSVAPSWTTLRVFRPSDGVEIASNSNGTYGTIDLASLPETGQYTVTIEPGGIVIPRNFGATTTNVKIPTSLRSTSGFSLDQATHDPAARPSQPPSASDVLNRKSGSALEQLAQDYQPTSPEGWTPTAPGEITTGRSDSPFGSMPDLLGPTGVTALAGHVLKLDGTPLAGVTLELGERRAVTDANGRFLIARASPGRQPLGIDGSTANSGEVTYGTYEASVRLKAGRTRTLPYTIWMSALDTAHPLHIPARTHHDVVLRNPAIPGLQVHIPKGTSITDEDGEPVHELSLTPIPVDRPPFPLPPFVQVPTYFTVQPGGSYLAPKGAWIVYPNTSGLAPGSTAEFWNYDPDRRGWYVYGKGTVSKDGERIVPDRRTRVWEFTGAMINGSWIPPFLQPGCNGDAGENGMQQPADFLDALTCGGDPLDLSNGLLAHRLTDLRLPGPMPIELGRIFRQNDANSYSFGLGTGLPYDTYLYSQNQYQEADLYRPGQRKVHFVRTSPGNDILGAVFEAQDTPGIFFRSKMVYNGAGAGWTLRRRDGLSFVYGDNAPLQEIYDRFGNRVILTRNPLVTGAITGLISYPSGRWFSLTRSGGVVTQAADNLGRTVNYTYDTTGGLTRLQTVTDANHPTTPVTYTWNSNTTVNANPSSTPSPGTYLMSISDSRGNTILTNNYDASGRIDQQTIAGGGQWLTDYTGGTQCPGSTKVTDPNGNIRCVGFDPSAYATTDIEAVGTADQRTFTLSLDATTHRIQTITDSFHARVTRFTYDTNGMVASVTRLDGTGSAETTNYLWDPHERLSSATDPLGHTVTMDYDHDGCLLSITDASSNQSTFTCNAAGQVASATYAGTGGSRTTTYGFSHGDLVSVTDPLGRTIKRFTDGGGRLLSITDPLGYRTKYTYDDLDNLKSVIDARAKTTSFLYDPNSNLTRITDALTHQTNFTYFSTNLLQTKTDALTHAESYAYDLKGNLTLRTDRKNQATEYRYNAYDRPTFIGFKRQGSPGSYTYESTLTLGYDGGWRMTSVADTTTGAGTIIRGYDDLDRLTSDQQPQGTATYTYWNDDRRKTMTAGNQAITNYSYFANGLLQQISQGSATIGFTYLPNHLPNTTTLAGGQVQTYSYDAATELTAIAYSGNGPPASSQITYGYDPNGRRTGVWDAYARVGLPTAMAGPAVYNAANQLTSWNSTANTYDLNGNLTAAGTQTYTWNARDQLTATSGGTSSFIYDGLGRRIKKVVSGATTKFLHDGLNPVQEQNNGGTPTWDLLTGLGLDQTYQRKDTIAGTSYNFLTDVLGSTVALVAGSTVTNTFTYQAYGTSTQTGSGTHSYRFTGREWDGATGLQFNRARYYNPTWGRFISGDPIGLKGSGANLYLYAGGRPTHFSDPTGLEPMQQADDQTCGGYIDINISFWSLDFGVAIDNCGAHYYGGSGFGFPGGSISYSPSPVSCVSESAQLGYGVNYSYGVGLTDDALSGFQEYGIATPGGSFYLNKIWHCPYE